MEQKKKQDHKFYGGFRYAIEGILTGIRQEQNMKMHCIMTVLVVLAGFFFEISKIEWCICLLLCGLIMALELVNTSVEAVVDLVTEERKPLAKIAKDTGCWCSADRSTFFCSDRLYYFCSKNNGMVYIFLKKVYNKSIKSDNVKRLRTLKGAEEYGKIDGWSEKDLIGRNRNSSCDSGEVKGRAG